MKLKVFAGRLFFGLDNTSLIGLVHMVLMIVFIFTPYRRFCAHRGFRKISTKNSQILKQPQISIDSQNSFIANEDSSKEEDEEQYNIPIRLVGGSK